MYILRLILFVEENLRSDISDTILWLSKEGSRVVYDFNVSRVADGLRDTPGAQCISL